MSYNTISSVDPGSLAEAVGVDLPELFRLREYGRRLDDAAYRLEKSRKSRPEKQ